jgi:hypothetical protein
MVAFLYFKSLVQHFPDTLLSDYLDAIFLNKDSSIKKIVNMENHVAIENNQGYFYPNIDPNIFYVPLTYTDNKEDILISIEKLASRCSFRSSILFLLDTFGSTYENLEKLSKKFKAIFVIDHHISLEHCFEGKTVPGNVFIYMNLEKSGVTLALDFFNGVEHSGYRPNIPEAYTFDRVVP